MRNTKKQQLLRRELLLLDRKRHTARWRYKDVKIAQEITLANSCRIFFPAIHHDHSDYALSLGAPWYFNGFIVELGKTRMVVDPGVDFMYRLVRSNYELETINSLFVSHEHLDHSSDANTLIDWLLRFQRNLKIFTNEKTISEARISRYHSKPKKFKNGNKHELYVASASSPVSLSDTQGIKFIPLNHDTECFGFTILDSKNDIKLSYISDTGYAKSLEFNGSEIDFHDIEYSLDATPLSYHYKIKKSVENSSTLIVNIDSFVYNRKSSTHLTVTDLLHLVKGSSIKLIIITHLNPAGELPVNKWGKKLSDYITKETSIECRFQGTKDTTISLK